MRICDVCKKGKAIEKIIFEQDKQEFDLCKKCKKEVLKAVQEKR